MTNSIPTYEDILLEGWEDVYRKSQLSLLILLSLKEGPKYTAQIKQFILESSNGLQRTDDQSIYRALRRYDKAEMVVHEEVIGTSGPNKKIYGLTDTGSKVLHNFLRRNIIGILYKPHMRKLIERI